MTTSAATKPKLGYDDYACLPDDGQRHEIVDGVHVVNPAPNVVHQSLSSRLQFKLFSHIERTRLGRVFHVPLDVQLSEHDVVQPDLVVVLASNEPRITAARTVGPPDLVVEILSPTSVALDRGAKKIAYERAGVPEYWLVDPAARTIEQFVLERGSYHMQPAPQYDVRLKIAPDVVIALDDLWDPSGAERG